MEKVCFANNVRYDVYCKQNERKDKCYYHNLTFSDKNKLEIEEPFFSDRICDETSVATEEKIQLCDFCFDSEIFSSSPVEYQTTNGCLCQKSWKVIGHEPCLESCCSPDGDYPWCLTTCESKGWGYCEVPVNYTTSKLTYPEKFWFEEEISGSVNDDDLPSDSAHNSPGFNSVIVIIPVVLIVLLIVSLGAYKKLFNKRSDAVYNHRKKEFKDDLES